MNMDNRPSKDNNGNRERDPRESLGNPLHRAEDTSPQQIEQFYRSVYTRRDREVTETQNARDNMLAGWHFAELFSSQNIPGKYETRFLQGTLANLFDDAAMNHPTKNLKDETYLRTRIGRAWTPQLVAQIEKRTPTVGERRQISRDMAALVGEALEQSQAEDSDMGALAEVLTLGLFSDKTPYTIIPASPREAGALRREYQQFSGQFHDGFIDTHEGKITIETKFFRERLPQSSADNDVRLQVGHKLNEAMYDHAIPTRQENPEEMHDAIIKVAQAFIHEQLAPGLLTDEEQELLVRSRYYLQEKIERDYREKGNQRAIADIKRY